MNIYALIIVIIVAIIGSSIMGFSVMDYVDEISALAKDKVREQKLTDDASPEERGNTKEKTGGIECDIKLNFVGSITGEPFFGEGMKVWMGEQSAFGGLVREMHDPSIMKYEWFNCSDPIDPTTGLKANSLVDMFRTFSIISSHNLRNMQLDSITKLSNESNLWINIDGRSLNGNGDFVGERTENGPKVLDFTGVQKFQKNTNLPASFDIEIIVRNVPLDDYEIKYWSEDWRINDEIVGHKFTKNVCLPTDPFVPC